MSAVSTAFEKAAAENRAALIGYLPAGFPDKDTGRAEYRSVSDAEAMEGFAALCRTEGIIPAIESSHALAGAMRLGRELGPDGLILVNLSGRGDKDVATASAWFGV